MGKGKEGRGEQIGRKPVERLRRLSRIGDDITRAPGEGEREGGARCPHRCNPRISGPRGGDDRVEQVCGKAGVGAVAEAEDLVRLPLRSPPPERRHLVYPVVRLPLRRCHLRPPLSLHRFSSSFVSFFSVTLTLETHLEEVHSLPESAADLAKSGNPDATSAKPPHETAGEGKLSGFATSRCQRAGFLVQGVRCPHVDT